MGTILLLSRAISEVDIDNHYKTTVHRQFYSIALIRQVISAIYTLRRLFITIYPANNAFY
jgi:hypothetical protein